MKTLVLATLLSVGLFAGTYDYDYSVDSSKQIVSSDKKLDSFMNGDFEEIIRFDALVVDDENATQDIDKISRTIKKYTDDSKNIRVKIIGHTSEATDEHNEMVVDSDVYANKIQNWFRFSLDANTSKELSKTYAQDVANALVDNNVSKDLLYVEYRSGEDMAYTDSTTQGRDLSNRVMVTLYVVTPEDKDSDGDGLVDSIDECKNTPNGVKIDKNGCALDNDKDLIANYKDECADTPLGVKVDAKGCPLDDDSDKVANYIDECPNTPSGVGVDDRGCALKMYLDLKFKRSSAKIKRSSHEKIVAFATFLEENPAYNVKITGHTDSNGKSGINMKLSKARANTVKLVLVAEGVEESRVETFGKGEIEPLETNRTKEGRAANRRIEIELTYK